MSNESRGERAGLTPLSGRLAEVIVEGAKEKDPQRIIQAVNEIEGKYSSDPSRQAFDTAQQIEGAFISAGLELLFDEEFQASLLKEPPRK